MQSFRRSEVTFRTATSVAEEGDVEETKGASALRTGSSAVKEEACANDRVYNHEYCSMTAEAKTPARNTVTTAADVFWNAPGPRV